MTRLSLTVLFLCAVVAPVAAQSTTSSIAGLVVDASKSPAPGATITVISPETGLSRTTRSDAHGVYRVLDVPPGTYTVAAELPGFAPAAVRTLVAVGQDATVDFALEIPRLDEKVVVTEVSSPLDARSTAIGGVVSRDQIAELPLNGRSFLQLATLQPGVVVSRNTGRDFTGGFGGTQLAIAGARPEQAGYLLDGTNIADISDKAPSSVAGGLLGVDTVREFSVQTHGYSAEFGRAAGGIVSAVTRSGTNQFHGSAFEFHRDSSLDARNYFDTGNTPGFRRDQFGGTIGGPVRRNSLFFFGSYEGLRAQQAVTRIARLPDRAAHDGFLPDGKGGLRAVTIDPGAQPYLDLLFPIPDGRDFGDGTAELRHAHRDPLDEQFVVAKIDWHPSAADTAMVRYSSDTADATSSMEHPLFREQTGTRARYLTAQHQHVFGGAALNMLRFAWNRTARTDDVVPTVTVPPSLYFTTDPHFGAITVTGVSPVGSSGTNPVDYDQHLFQVLDTFTWSRGAHVLKTGGDWQRYDFSGFSYSRYGGEFRFRNLQEFLTLHRSATAQADRFTGNEPGTDTQRDMRQDYMAFFVQDEWRARPDLTLNLGLRYDFVTTPTEKKGRVAGLLSLDDLESGPHGVTPGTPLFDNPSKRSFAPRLGATWAPGESQETVVRGGFGLFFQPLTVSYYRGTAFRIFPYFAGVDIRQPAVFGPGIQDVLAEAPPSTIQRRSEFIFYEAKQPFVEQWHLDLQRRLWGGFTGELGYLGSSGHNLPFYGDPNSIPAERLADGRKRVIPGASLRYPSWGRVRTRINIAHSAAHALVAGLRRQLSNGLMLQAAYTYAHSTDTWSGGQQASADFDGSPGAATDWWDPEDELGPSSFDVRHTLVVNGVYELPWGRSLNGLAAMLGQGWQVAGLLQLASGLPFTPFIGFDRAGDEQSDADILQKPDQVGPVRYLRSSDAWFDASAFALPPPGYYGNARRNSLRGPGLKTADLSVFKDIRLARTVIQVRIEAFNAFNWVNFGLPDASALFNTDGTPRPGAGRITSTATPARQVQIGLKLTF